MHRSIFYRRMAVLACALLLVIGGSIVVYAGTFRLLSPVQSDQLFYSDANITISFIMRPGKYGIGYEGISFTITNKCSHAIAVDWNRSSLTLPNGQISNVMHEGTLFISRGTTTPPTTIPPGGKLSDSAIPTRNVFYMDGWEIHPMAIKSGSRFGLYLALDGIETTNGYNFTFEAVDVESEFSQTLSFILAMLVLVGVLGLISIALDL